MFDVFYSGIKPNQFAHERAADSIEHAQKLCRTRYFWWITYLCDYSTFNWDFQPVPWQSEYTHTWPSQHHEYSGTYLVPRTGEIKYHFHKKVIPNKCNLDNFNTLINGIDFDYSWAPHPHDPPYIYVFGNQWWSAEKMPTVEYTVAGATQHKYMDRPQAKLQPQHNNCWHMLVNCEWDYSWVPDPGDSPYIHVFGNQHWSGEKMPTVEYHVPGATERKYVRWPTAKLLPDRSRWVIPDTIDPASIDYSWVPDPGDPPYTYQFGTQWQRTGGPVYTVPGATEIKYVEQIKIKVDSTSAVIVEIDHLDGNAGQIPNTTKCVRYFDNYRDTLIRLAKNLQDKHEFVWVCSSICDYSKFDFTWHPEQWQATMLHVFASDEQKFGDTFYMHVPTFAEYAGRKALLEWYDVNFVTTSVPRRPVPVIRHDFDSQAEAVRTLDWAGPLALFTNTDYVSGNLVTVPLWRENVKTVVPLSSGATSVIVPKTAVPYVKTQLYDYAYIDKTHRVLKDQPLDIVFIDNGERDADSNFTHLNNATYNLPNRLHRSSGVNGRVAAYQAAANMSETPWFFAVFAKLQVDQHFDWSWQSDRMQQAKHYIFHAGNPVNGLVYGHQAMIAYNRQLVRENTGTGLDFTLDQAHEVVPIFSGTAMYAESPWMAWRTAFREALKLRASLPDVENEYRLNAWLKEDSGTIANGHWSSKGAADAVDYYEEVGGDFEALKKSYEWAWLASYVFVKRGLTTDQ